MRLQTSLVRKDSWRWLLSWMKNLPVSGLRVKPQLHQVALCSVAARVHMQMPAASELRCISAEARQVRKETGTATCSASCVALRVELCVVHHVASCIALHIALCVALLRCARASIVYFQQECCLGHAIADFKSLVNMDCLDCD